MEVFGFLKIVSVEYGDYKCEKYKKLFTYSLLDAFILLAFLTVWKVYDSCLHLDLI